MRVQRKSTKTIDKREAFLYYLSNLINKMLGKMERMESMKRTKRAAAAMLVMGILGSALTGCGGADSGASLRFSWWGADARHVPYQEAIDKYQQGHEGVEVLGEFQGFDGYQQKILTQMAGKQEPDIMVLDAPWYPEMISKGDFFYDIKSSSEAFDTANMDRKLIDDYGIVDGKLIAIPMGYNARTVLVNADLAQTVGGIDLEQRYSWADLHDLGKKIHAEHPDVYLAAPCPSELVIMVREYLKQKTGEQLYSEDYTRGYEQADLAEALNWISACYQDGVFQPLGEAGLYEAKGEQNPLWVNGKVLMTFQWTSGINRFMDTLPEGTAFDVMPYPQHEAAKDGAALMRPIFLASISKNSKSPDEAVKFLNWFLNDKEAGAILGSANGVPASSVQSAAAEEQGLLEPLMIKGIDYGTDSAAQRENGPSTNSELDSMLDNAISEVAVGGVDAQAEAAKMIPLIDKKCGELK